MCDYLQRDWQFWEQFEIRHDQPLPIVLTRNEVHQLLGAARENRFKGGARPYLSLQPACW
jgi:hypothetical protein